MKTEGIGGILKLGEDAFRLSSDFQQEVERMVTNIFLPNPYCSIIGSPSPACSPRCLAGNARRTAFPPAFLVTTSEAVGIGKRIGLSESTVKRFLREGAREFIRKEAHGHYCKI